MTPASNTLARVRDIALLLPEVEERSADGVTTFVVSDAAFVKVCGDDALRVRGEADAAEWVDVGIEADADWTLIEDRIARSWELAAPRRLLEAGGR